MGRIAICRNFLLCLLLGVGSHAQEAGEPTVGSSFAELLEERNSQEVFERKLEGARAAGLTDQASLEARFLFHLDREETAQIAALLPAFLEADRDFDSEASALFTKANDWSAVVEYVKAVAALEAGSPKDFEKHIKQAFWLSPEQGEVFARDIERYRKANEMMEVELDLTHRYPLLFGDGEGGIIEEDGNEVGALLYFWSPKCRECRETFEDHVSLSRELESRSIHTVGVLPETSEEVVAEAKAFLSEHELSDGGAWLIDRRLDALSERLGIESVPFYVMISRQGRVVFYGRPTDGKLRATINGMNAAD